MAVSKIFYPFPSKQPSAFFLGRPQRFLASVRFGSGAKFMAYCANPGSFNNCFRVGSPAILSTGAGLGRKLAYTLCAVKSGRTWVGANTHLANALVEQSIRMECISGLEGYSILVKEPVTHLGHRLDFLLVSGEAHYYLEVKSATVAFNGIAQFPDSKTPRAIKHLNELRRLVERGQKAALLFLIQRSDVSELKINRGYDYDFDKAYDKARTAGVEVRAIKHKVLPAGFGPPMEIPVI